MSIVDRVRPELRALRGYSSARMEASGGRIMLNANESPWPGAAHAAAGLNRYPEPQPAGLRTRLAELYGVPCDNVLVARGSDEAIDVLTRAFCRAERDAILTAPPTFGMYAVCAAIQGAAVIPVPLAREDFGFRFDAAIDAATGAVKLVYVCSPNNPTGGVAPAAAILDLAARLAGRALVVVDEAYIEFADSPSLAPDATRVSNLAVLRTLSKAHGLAGARIGVLIADAELIALLRRLMPPYPLATPCVRAAEAALTADALAATRQRIALLRTERGRLAAELGRCPEVIRVLASHANFLAVRFDDAAGTYRRLLDRGIVVRDISHYRELAGYLRISVGRPDENDALLTALRERRAAA